MRRVKATAQRAPQTKEAAIERLERFAVVSAEIARLDADRQEQVARINASADVAIAPLAAELKAIAAELKPWWAANFDDLTGGKRKSIELGGCTLGYRMTPPKVHFANGNDEDAALALGKNGYLKTLVRVALAPDKPAILRVLEGDADAAAPLLAMGFSVKQREEFFIDLPAPPADTVTLP